MSCWMFDYAYLYFEWSPIHWSDLEAPRFDVWDPSTVPNLLLVVLLLS